jgi:4'-phosphopantetheinyl transferase
VAWELIGGLLPGARLTNPCAVCGGPHGAVRVHDVDAVASATYSGDLALVAVSGGAGAIGVDAEKADAAGARLDRVLGRGTDLRAWVRVEAVLKADGRGLRADPGLVHVDAAPDGWTARLAGAPETFLGRDIAGPPGILVSVALRGPRT